MNILIFPNLNVLTIPLADMFTSMWMPHRLFKHWFSSIQSLSHVQLFVTPWTAARQASLSITNSRSLPKPMSTESVMSSNHLILCFPLLLLPSIFSSIRVFSDVKSQLFASGGQSIGVSASTSVLAMNTQDWSSLGWTGWISLQSKGLSRVFSNTTVQKQQFLRSPKFNLFYHPTQLVYWQVLSTQLPKCYLQSIHFFPSPPSPVPRQTSDLLSLNKTLNGSPHIKHNPFPTHYPKWTEESLWKEMQGMLLFCLNSITSFTIRIG